LKTNHYKNSLEELLKNHNSLN